MPLEGIKTSDTFTVINKTLTNANTQYSQVLGNNVKQFFIKARSQSASVKFCFTTGETATTYVTLPANGYWSPDGLELNDITIYAESPQAGTVLEIITYS